MSRARVAIGTGIRNATPSAQRIADTIRVSAPVSPDVPVVIETSHQLDLCIWAAENREEVSSWLRSHGAVLLRGFRVESIEEFGNSVDAIAGQRMAYMNRSSPRTTVGDRIYTSTDYPKHLSIFPHNEHGYSPVFPLYLFFCCLHPAERGGATPIASTRLVGESVPEHIRERFRHKGVLYVRNYHEGFGLSWRQAFQTESREDVERYCADRGITCEWPNNGTLRTKRIGPAEITHPRTGEAIWFNHATFYHVSTLPDSVRQELAEAFREDEMPNQTYYGDGAAIEPDVLDELRSAYLKHLRRFEWRSGDVLAMDNILAVHARDPFVGSRRVLVSMVEDVCIH